jgi:hypothetical protein
MRTHPYVRTAFIGLVVGIVVGLVFYLVLRAFGTDANGYLLAAIVIFCIPGAIMLSELLESDELDKTDWPEEQEQYAEGSRTRSPKP